MLVVGLTGGIGSGKSTVADLLARRGAVVIDADKVAREVVEPGTDALRDVVEAFGPEVLAPDGTLDRGALAEIVFRDIEARQRLESIVWPKVGERISGRLHELAGSESVVVLDVPLMAESKEGSARLADLIVVVDASDHIRLERLEARGMSRADAEARMGAQASREERLAIADEVVANDSDLEELARRVDDLWDRLVERGKAKART